MAESPYLTDVVILLIAAVTTVPLFQFLRLGIIPGYLVAGVVIGPWGLSIIYRVEEIRHLAEFGVVFLLFIIGIELRPSRLWLMRRSVFGLGMAQMLVTGVLMSWLAMAFGLPERASLIIGFGLALSSTAFGLQILVEKGDLLSAYGRTAFSILLLQDLAVVPLIALIPLLADKGLSLTVDIELAVLETLLILLGVLLLGRLLLRPLLNVVAGLRSSEVFVASAILIVLGTAWLTDRAGLSMALGAFLAGMLLSDSRYRHQITADIKPFRGILLGLFFMTVGMSIDFGLLVRQGTEVASLVGGLLLIKAVLLWVLCRVTGRSHGESVHVALLLPQGGEFGFILFGLAYGAGVMNAELYQILVLVVVMSMVLTPLLFKMAPLLGRLPLRAATSRFSALEQIPESRNHVIVAGFGRFGQRVARILSKAGITYRAVDINPARVAEGRALGCAVYYGDARRIDMLDASGASNAALVVFAVDDTETVAQGAAVLRATHPQLPIYARVSDSRVGQMLHSMGVDRVFPETLEASLQVAGEVLSVLQIEPTTAAGLLEGMRRQENEKLAKVVPADRKHKFKDILLVLSSETDAQILLACTAKLPQGNQTLLTVMHVISAPPADKRTMVEALRHGNFRDGMQEQQRQRLDELVAPLRKRNEVEVIMRMGTPALEVVRDVLRRERDLVVKVAEPNVGIRRRLFGDTDMQLLRKCPCPVWFVRSQRLKPFRRIMAAVKVDTPGVDQKLTGVALNKKILELGFSLAMIELAEFHVVHVWQVYGEDILRSGRSPFPQRDTVAYIRRERKRHLNRLQELLADVRASIASKTIDSVEVKQHLAKGDPRIEITRLAQSLDVDLLIIGTAGHTGIRHFILGDTAQAIFHRLECSVLAVKPPDFVTPINLED